MLLGWVMESPCQILCLGTTGMLAECTRRLLCDGHRVHALARTAQSLRQLGEGLDAEQVARLSTWACDYHDSAQLALTLGRLPDTISRVICWVHRPAERPLMQVCARFPDADLLRVLGSSTTTIPDPAPYRTVRLGAVVEHAGTRWLSHDEISQGVYEAFVSGRQKSTVGSSVQA